MIGAPILLHCTLWVDPSENPVHATSLPLSQDMRRAKQAMLGTPFVLWFIGAFPAPASCKEPLEVDVAIVGAGVSGLAAAKALGAHNASFVVLEARNRTGGRVHAVSFGPGADSTTRHAATPRHLIETGANWVQGLEGNVVWQWAKSMRGGPLHGALVRG